MFIAYSTVASLAFGIFGFLVGADYKETLAEERELRRRERLERLKRQAEREREKNCRQTMKVFCNFKIV